MADSIELSKFFRKWGKFSHSTNQINYYQISANILGHNNSINKFINFEMFFDKVFVEDISLIDKTQNEYNYQQTVANQLLNVSHEDWEEYSYLFNQLSAKERIKPLSESKGDIIVEFDLNKVNENDINLFLIHLQQIIDETNDLGEFEYQNFKISINKKENKSKEKININNPKIKTEHFYQIF